MTRLSSLVMATSTMTVLLASSLAGRANGEAFTPIHEAGRCAIRDQCGSKSLFGGQLPCLDNGLATEPDDGLREQLTELCGAKWSTGAVCCSAEQVKTLKKSLATANQMISSCPACKDNFYNMFCTFTCSPDQSLFVNVTKTMQKNGKTLVTELDQLVSEPYGSGLYGSCKDVKFGPTNSRAIDLIGGGAKNYSQMLTFLGKERFGGSPFQINFPTAYEEPGMAARPMTPKRCNDEDPNFRCACVDCPAVCPELPAVVEAGSCHVGVLPCLSFASIFAYGLLLFSFVAFFGGRVAWRRHTRRRNERLRLLTDASPSDDEDDDDDDERVYNEAVAAAAAADFAQIDAMRDRPQKTYIVNTWCDAAFSRLGHMAARFPGQTIFATLLLVTVLSVGWVRFELEQDPARLWVSPTSAAAQEKAFFDDSFGPFYRAEKIFLVNDTLPTGPGPVLSADTLVWWMGVERSVAFLRGPKFGTTLQDVCLKPTGSACVVQSVAAYFEDDPDAVDPRDWADRLRACAASPVECRPAYGQPIDPSMILGGFSDDGSGSGSEQPDPATAAAMTVTWVVNNFAEGSPRLDHAMDWEGALRDRLLAAQDEARDRGLRLSFSTEISLEQELNKSTNTDAKIIVISYVIMFLYASVALGSTTLTLRDLARNPAVALVESKFTLGVAGILIVLMSITSSIGLFAWAGLKATLIIVDVIPFIVLAVGVDNIFLIVHEFERVNISHPDEVVERRIAKALGRIGPSILFSAATETVSFALGTFVGMPAVRNFAAYAAGAVFINAILQVTMFVAVLALNQMRVEEYRADCFPCLPLKAARIHLEGGNGVGNGVGGSSGSMNNNHMSYNGYNNNGNGHGAVGPRFYEAPRESLLQQFIATRYAPALLGRKVKATVVLVFLGIFAAAVALLPGIELGLDQRVAIPDDSYLIPYFNDLYDYFDAGPPVYFVARGLDATQRADQRQICSRYTTCAQMSLPNILEQERKRTGVSYIASPTASWIDDFFQWLNPENDACCVEGRKTCFADRDPAWNITLAGMPEGDEFVHYLEKFLAAPTDENCPLGGQASYGSAVVVDAQTGTVPASHFRTAHSPLRSQDDFIAAYASARRIAAEITEGTGIDVFPYSVFYVFFDQYATIVGLTAALLGAAVAIIFVLASLLLGSLRTAAVVTITVAMIVVDIMGAMAVMRVSLNAVSLVNLIICVGIAVEFCAHVARAFAFPSRTLLERARLRFPSHSYSRNGSGGGNDNNDARAWTSLANVGASVFSGITITKLLGVCVLAFTRSKIFEVYYFRVWVALVVFAASHALVFLPVALALLGGEGYVADPESYSSYSSDPYGIGGGGGGPGGGGLEDDLAQRRYRGMGPAGAAGYEDDDEDLEDDVEVEGEGEGEGEESGDEY